MIPASLFHPSEADTLKGIDIASLLSPSRHIYVELQIQNKKKVRCSKKLLKGTITAAPEAEGDASEDTNETPWAEHLTHGPDVTKEELQSKHPTQGPVETIEAPEEELWAEHPT